MTGCDIEKSFVYDKTVGSDRTPVTKTIRRQAAASQAALAADQAENRV